MKKSLLFFSIITLISTGWSQMTTVYETGYGTTDGWTGWTSQTSGVGAENVNGVNHYIFTLSGSIGTNFAIEISRNFTITGTPINVYYTVFAQDATLDLMYSTDNISWTSIGSDTYGSTYSSAAYVKVVSPAVSNYYLKLRIAGTVGDQMQVNFSNFKIDADQSSVDLKELNQDVHILQQNGQLTVINAPSNLSSHIYNLNGQLVYSSVNENTIDLSGFQHGTYIVKIQDQNKNLITQKIVI